MQDHSFPKSARILRSADFTDIIRRGAYAADEVMVINVRWAEGNRDCLAKLGISIPKKTGNAVIRNRWKRWFREVFRLKRGRLPRGIEIVVRPKRDAQGSYDLIDRSLEKAVSRAVRKLNG